MRSCDSSSLPELSSADGRSKRRWARRAASALAAVALLAGGPATAAPVLPSAPETVVGEHPPPGLGKLYAQTPEWAPCGAAAECARVRVPLDYDDPAGAEIELAVKRVPSPDPAARQGSLFVNFGGPGGSGTEAVETWAQALDPGVLGAYDVVGFDPRGVADSTAVECVDDAALDALRATRIDPDTEEGLAELTAQGEQLAAACAASTGPLLGEVDTVSAARDLDVLRAALGEKELDYLGYSYGTLLGATYADLFPERTGRLVLDAAVDPALDYAEVRLGQLAAFERSLRVYAATCLPQDGCPFEGTVGGAVAEIESLLERIEAEPLPTADGRLLTVGDAVSAIVLPLYDERIWWLLTQALVPALERGDGTALMALADTAYGRAPDGTYVNNFVEANAAITCLTWPVDTDPAAMAALDAQLQEASPTLGDWFSHGELRCGVSPYGPVPERGPISAEGAAPILVVGGTGDPATPYAWSQALTEQLGSGRLLTRVGEGHVSYARGNACVDVTVNAFLLEGALPAEETVC